MRLNPILASLGGYQIAEVQERAHALRDAGKPLIDFSIGDPREPTPPFIAEALKAAVPAISQYPLTAGRADLRQAIADYLGRRFGVEVDPDTQIIPTSGSKEAVFSSPLAFVESGAGEAVVYGTPGYPIYQRGALFAGADAYGLELKDDFVLRARDIPVDVWERARIVWTCTPHNPTGAVTSAADLEVLVERGRRHDAMIFSDECYADVYEGEPPASTLQVAGSQARNVLAFFSLSKRSGMTGYRSGAIVGDPDAIAALKKLRTGTGTASPDFVQGAAIAAWSDDAHAAERREIFARKRAILRSAFADLGYETVASQAGLYLWVRVGDDMAMTGKLLEAGVVVSPGRAFGGGGAGFIRLALVPTVQECEAATKVVQACLTGN